MDNNNNWDLIPKNELSAKARSGTELMLERIYDGTIPRDLLEKVEIIPSRYRPDKLDPKKKWIWYEHNLSHDPESAVLSDPDFRNKLASIVFVSHWQMEKFNLYNGVPYAKSVVIENAITPIDVDTEKKFSGRLVRPIKLIYHTTPHRGLAILIPVFEQLVKMCPFPIELDVYSSFELYGWKQRDQQFEKLFDFAKTVPGVTVHGSVPNEQIREALKTADIYAYPSIWQETSCLSGIEAISAGCFVVTPNLAALPETLGKYPSTRIYQWDENVNIHAAKFAKTLSEVINLVKFGTTDQILGMTQTSQNLLSAGANNWQNGCQTWQMHIQSLLG